MTVIEIPDDQAAALKARAAAQGLTLEDWLRKLAGAETAAGQARKGRYSLSDLVAECDLNAPLSDEDRAWLDALPFGREA